MSSPFRDSPPWLRAGILLAACLAGPLHAQSQNTEPSLHWACVQHRDPLFTVACAAHATGEFDTPPTAPVDPVPPFASRDLRPVAARGVAEALSARSWHIPLMAPPTHGSRVIELLEAVLCGNVAGCEVDYQATTPAPR